jgi:glycosyltransferase involved in cell wall biosynthesis
MTGCPSLTELPTPPAGKNGWPWTEEAAQLPETMPDGPPWPKISIVTPSYNQGQFIEETIRSVLLQGYTNLEYIVMDGGSTDNSVDVIRKYESWITFWESTPDRGQAHAINKGLAHATGEWFNWINSDDILLPNGLGTLAKVLEVGRESEPQWVVGARIELDKDGGFCDVNQSWRTDPAIIGLGALLNIPQDAVFVRRELLTANGLRLDESFHIAFDTVFYSRLLEYGKPLLTTAVFSGARWYGERKSAQKAAIQAELLRAGRPQIRHLRAIPKLIFRLLNSRFNAIVQPCLRMAVVAGWVPYARDWKSVVFDGNNNRYVMRPAYQSIVR